MTLVNDPGDPARRPPSEQPTVKLGRWRRRRLARGSVEPPLGKRYPRDPTDVVLWLAFGLAAIGFIVLLWLLGCGGQA